MAAVQYAFVKLRSQHSTPCKHTWRKAGYSIWFGDEQDSSTAKKTLEFEMKNLHFQMLKEHEPLLSSIFHNAKTQNVTNTCGLISSHFYTFEIRQNKLKMTFSAGYRSLFKLIIPKC